MLRKLGEWWRELEQLLLAPAPTCGLCRERPSLPVGACRLCLDSLSIGWKKGAVHEFPHFSLFPYQGFGREVIHRLKFQGALEVGVVLGTFLGLAAREEPELAKVDLLLPVPLAPGRLQQRGFNQALLLADNIRRVWKKPVREGIVRTRETKPQSGLSAAARKSNLQGAFELLPSLRVAGKLCLIVDDVITSGQTFLALAQLIASRGGRAAGLFAARTEMWRSE